MLSLFFSFHGRINRAQYWLGSFMSSFIGFVLIAMIVSVGAGAAMDAAGKGAKFAIALSSMLLALPVLALMSWSGLAIQVKRFHDRGRTGWRRGSCPAPPPPGRASPSNPNIPPCT